MAFAIPLAAGAASALGATETAAAITSFGASGFGTLLSGLGTATSVLGAFKGAQGAKQQGQANSQAALYAATLAQRNAQIDQQNKAWAGAQGSAAVEQEGLKNRAKVGAITADQGASGIDINKGSAVDVRSSAAETGQLSAINIRAAAARQAYGFDTQATNDKAQAAMDKATAANDITAGNQNAATTLLGGIGNAGAAYGNYLTKNSPFGGATSSSSDPYSGYQIQDMNGIGAF